jgi:3-dehydroquinate dehydratase type I
VQHKYCLPLIEQQQSNVLDAIKQNETDYAFFEVWVDYLEEFNEGFVEKLVNSWPHKIIIVFRRQDLAPIHMPLSYRFKLLALLHDSTALVDLDVVNQLAELEYLRSNKLRLQTIVSHHNYQETPETKELQQIASTIASHNPTILKIATFCQSDQDALRLLQLQLGLKQQHQRHVILGMGPHGISTRIFGSLWGNELIFAPNIARKQSAPGQLTRHRLEIIFESLNA